MTLRQALHSARALLEAQRIENTSLTAEVLLRHVLNINRVRLYQDPDLDLTSNQETVFFDLVRRHINGEPVAYLTGHKEFYGLDFFVDEQVLIPRPETELLIEQALVVAKARDIKSIADIGTGSGAISVILASYLTTSTIYATDSSAEAIAVARLNSRHHNVENNIIFLIGDLSAPLPEPVDLIIANLPYIQSSELAEPSIRFEPRIALDGGPDGLDQIRRFIPQAGYKLNTGGSVLMEIGQGQSQAVISLIRDNYPEAKIKIFTDFNKIERVIYFS